MNADQPIGIIDSGVGGLTILKSLNETFPKESFIYFGDTQHAPYGEKDINIIANLTETMVRFLEKKEVKGLVIACNTITASNALNNISTTIPFTVEIVKPTVQYAISQSKSNEFTILATEVTLQSGLYQNLLAQHKLNTNIDTYSLPLLVKLAESGDFESIEAEKLIENLSNKISNSSTVILGCTHYPFFTPIFKKYFDPSISIIDSSISTASELQNKLFTLELLGNERTANEYYISGDTQKFSTIVNTYFKD